MRRRNVIVCISLFNGLGYTVKPILVITLKATIDLAYPSNRFMFGYMIDDTPMLFVKKAGADVTMLNGHFEQGSFTLKDWNEWGFRVTTDKLGKFYFIDFSTKVTATQGHF